MPNPRPSNNFPGLACRSSLTRLVLPRASHHLTQLGAPYSEREKGSLTVSEDHGQTFILLSLVHYLAHVSKGVYLKTSRRLCACFTERPRHAIGRSSAIAIDYLQPTWTSLELLL